MLIDCANKDAFFGLNRKSKYVYTNKTIWDTFIGIKGDMGYRKTSSFLTEIINGKKIEYDGSGERYYYQLTKPWVEGKDGYGIDEWIEKRIVNNIDEIVFFNGYISPNRPDLFFANSRVKEILITSDQYSETFHVADTPNPQILKLNKKVSGDIRFTIKDVYKGNKYQDTCIAGIYFLRIRGQ